MSRVTLYPPTLLPQSLQHHTLGGHEGGSGRACLRIVFSSTAGRP